MTLQRSSAQSPCSRYRSAAWIWWRRLRPRRRRCSWLWTAICVWKRRESFCLSVDCKGTSEERGARTKRAWESLLVI